MPTSLYSKDEKVLCFHQELLYDAKILELRHQDPNDRKSDFEYLVHYKGWKNTWDDWVTEERLRKANEDNRELAAHLKRTLEATMRVKNTKSASKKHAMSDRSSVRDSEERGSSVPGRAAKRARGDNDIQTEEDFYEIPSLHFELTDNLKALLVDDWERVTKNFSVVKLPAPKPVRQILQDWHDDEFPKRVRIEQDVLKTVMNGTMEYFDIVLEKSLLYRYERAQYRHMKETYQSAEGTGPSDIYGAEHLLRCLSTMGDNLAPTDMTAPQARVWRTQMANFSLFLSRNSDTYFRCEYIPIEDSYGDKKKSGR